eukprot:jgi/Mesvir1/4352/Mv02436-RA.1
MAGAPASRGEHGLTLKMVFVGVLAVIGGGILWTCVALFSWPESANPGKESLALNHAQALLSSNTTLNGHPPGKTVGFFVEPDRTSRQRPPTLRFKSRLCPPVEALKRHRTSSKDCAHVDCRWETPCAPLGLSGPNPVCCAHVVTRLLEMFDAVMHGLGLPYYLALQSLAGLFREQARLADKKLARDVDALQPSIERGTGMEVQSGDATSRDRDYGIGYAEVGLGDSVRSAHFVHEMLRRECVREAFWQAGLSFFSTRFPKEPTMLVCPRRDFGEFPEIRPDRPSASINAASAAATGTASAPVDPSVAAHPSPVAASTQHSSPPPSAAGPSVFVSIYHDREPTRTVAQLDGSDKDQVVAMVPAGTVCVMSDVLYPLSLVNATGNLYPAPGNVGKYLDILYGDGWSRSSERPRLRGTLGGAEDGIQLLAGEWHTPVCEVRQSKEGGFVELKLAPDTLSLLSDMLKQGGAEGGGGSA